MSILVLPLFCPQGLIEVGGWVPSPRLPALLLIHSMPAPRLPDLPPTLPASACQDAMTYSVCPLILPLPLQHFFTCLCSSTLDSYLSLWQCLVLNCTTRLLNIGLDTTAAFAQCVRMDSLPSGLLPHTYPQFMHFIYRLICDYMADSPFFTYPHLPHQPSYTTPYTFIMR